MGWLLNRTVQCAKCPWKKSTDPREIPDGYSEEKHRDLISTIASPGDLAGVFAREIKAMACHESVADHCVGWMANQLGPGNNIALRLLASSCTNIRRLRTVGEQHERFVDTLPKATEVDDG